MTEAEALKKVQDFIYNDETQENLEKRNNHLLPINVLEISGMGNQEIKHSNVLAWMFGDKQHQLGYQILEKFLARVIAIENHNAQANKIADLRRYSYFKHPKNRTIEREYSLFYGDKKEKCVVLPHSI